MSRESELSEEQNRFAKHHQSRTDSSEKPFLKKSNTFSLSIRSQQTNQLTLKLNAPLQNAFKPQTKKIIRFPLPSYLRFRTSITYSAWNQFPKVFQSVKWQFKLLNSPWLPSAWTDNTRKRVPALILALRTTMHLVTCARSAAVIAMDALAQRSMNAWVARIPTSPWLTLRMIRTAESALAHAAAARTKPHALVARLASFWVNRFVSSTAQLARSTHTVNAHLALLDAVLVSPAANAQAASMESSDLTRNALSLTPFRP